MRRAFPDIGITGKLHTEKPLAPGGLDILPWCNSHQCGDLYILDYIIVTHLNRIKTLPVLCQKNKKQTHNKDLCVCMLMLNAATVEVKKKKHPMKAFPHLSPFQEERHQLQLHPPVSGDNGTLRSRDSKSHPGSVTPTMRVSLPVLLDAHKAFIKYEFPSSQTCSLGQSQAPLLTDGLRPSVSLTRPASHTAGYKWITESLQQNRTFLYYMIKTEKRFFDCSTQLHQRKECSEFYSLKY